MTAKAAPMTLPSVARAAPKKSKAKKKSIPLDERLEQGEVANA